MQIHLSCNRLQAKSAKNMSSRAKRFRCQGGILNIKEKHKPYFAERMPINMTKMLEEIKQQPSVLSQLEEANRETLNALIKEMKVKNIKNAVLAGRGTSDHACIFAQYVLGLTCGIVTGLAIPSLLTLYRCKPDFSSHLVIGISQSGKAADALSLIDAANTSGGISVAITNDPESPMALAAKYHLYCNAGPEISVAATKTFTAQMGLVLLLAAYLTENETLLAAFRRLPDAMRKLDELCDEKITETALSFRYMKDGFVLSRGITYPVALESMLKIQETCYVKMRGYAVSDFYHGPLAQVDAETPVIVLTPNGVTHQDHLDMIDRLRSIGTQPLVVAPENSDALSGTNQFAIPDTGNEITDAFLFAMFAQRFSECLCGLKGLNPDAPRNLKKVTVTR